MEEQEEKLEDEELDDLIWDRPYYSLKKTTFIPCVYEGNSTEAKSPFNAVTIHLDGRLQADLSWKKARKEAQQAVDQGFALFWEIDLGLFDQLTFALVNQTQYLSLCLSLEHFRDTLWKEFKSVSLGLSLYRGSADFSYNFPWNDQQLQNLREWLQHIFEDEKQFEKETALSLFSFSKLELSDLDQNKEGKQLIRIFCRDVIVEYLSLLASRLPDALPCYLFLDARELKTTLLWQAQLLHPERFEQLNMILKGETLPFEAWGWETASYSYGYIGEKEAVFSSLTTDVKIGVCLPSITIYKPSQFIGLEEALQLLLKHSVAIRLIAEDHLITKWDGLDYLIYVPAGLSLQGKRKLQGFCAAGGTVVFLGEGLGLPNEQSFEAFCQHYI